MMSAAGSPKSSSPFWRSSSESFSKSASLVALPVIEASKPPPSASSTTSTSEATSSVRRKIGTIVA